MEAREAVAAPAKDRHAGRLEPFDRGRNVEHALRARAHRHDRVAGEGGQVGGLVERLAVYATDAAGGERAHTRRRGGVEGGRDGGAGGPARRDERGQVPGRSLGGRSARQAFHLCVVEAHDQAAVEHAHRRRDRAAVAHDPLQRAPQLEVARPREPVGQHGRLERDHRMPGGERGGDVGGDLDHAGMIPPGRARGAVPTALTRRSSRASWSGSGTGPW